MLEIAAHRRVLQAARYRCSSHSTERLYSSVAVELGSMVPVTLTWSGAVGTGRFSHFRVNQFALTFLEQIVAALSDPALVQDRAITDSRSDVAAFAVEFGKHFTTRGVSPTVKSWLFGAQ